MASSLLGTQIASLVSDQISTQTGSNDSTNKNIRFALTEEQTQRLRDWSASRPFIGAGAIGGRYTYQFTPTNIGLIIKIEDVLGKETLDLTDYEDW